MSDDRERAHYALAKQHIADAEIRVARQREIIQTRRAAHQDTTAAQALLVTMLKSLELMREHLRMIEAELTRDGQ